MTENELILRLVAIDSEIERLKEIRARFMEDAALGGLAPVKIGGRWRVLTETYFGAQLRVDRIWLEKRRVHWYDVDPVYYWAIEGRQVRGDGRVGRRTIKTYHRVEAEDSGIEDRAMGYDEALSQSEQRKIAPGEADQVDSQIDKRIRVQRPDRRRRGRRDT